MKILKKYANRKIYDTEAHKYVTIGDIRKMVEAKQIIQVIDEKSGEDITRSVLMQILADLEANGSQKIMTDYVLHYLIGMYSDPLGSSFSTYLELSLKNFLNFQSSVNKQIDNVFIQNQIKTFQEINQRMLKDWSDLMGMSGGKK